MRAPKLLLILLSLTGAAGALADGPRTHSSSAAAGIQLTIRSQVSAYIYNDTLCVERWGSENYQLGTGPHGLDGLRRAGTRPDQSCAQPTATAYLLPTNKAGDADPYLTLVVSVE